jgi:hypothetical protein
MPSRSRRQGRPVQVPASPSSESSASCQRGSNVSIPYAVATPPPSGWLCRRSSTSPAISGNETSAPGERGNARCRITAPVSAARRVSRSAAITTNPVASRSSGTTYTEPRASADHIGWPVARSTPRRIVRCGGSVCGTPVADQ